VPRASWQKKATRFRPAEIAASASIKPLPAGFAQAEIQGGVLLKNYNDHFYPVPAGSNTPAEQTDAPIDATSAAETYAEQTNATSVRAADTGPADTTGGPTEQGSG
jgi:hypothetical protein